MKLKTVLDNEYKDAVLQLDLEATADGKAEICLSDDEVEMVMTGNLTRGPTTWKCQLRARLFGVQRILICMI